MLPPVKVQPPAERILASADEMEGFYQHLEQALVAVEFLSQDHPGKLLRRLRRLFNRAQLTQVELNIMRGIFSAMLASSQKRP